MNGVLLWDLGGRGGVVNGEKRIVNCFWSVVYLLGSICIVPYRGLTCVASVVRVVRCVEGSKSNMAIEVVVPYQA